MHPSTPNPLQTSTPLPPPPAVASPSSQTSLLVPPSDPLTKESEGKEESKEDLKEDLKEEEEMEVESEKSVIPIDILAPSAASILSPGGLPLLPPLMEKQRAIVKPQILTHVIDGYVIQEGPEPFPVQRSSLLTEFVPPKPVPAVEKDSGDETAENDDQPPPLLTHFSASNEDTRVCEYCGKNRHAQSFRNSGRFCSMTCSKRYSVAFSKRGGKMKGGPTAGKYTGGKKKLGLAVKKGWRASHGGRLAYNINMTPAAAEMSSSNSGQETSSSAASPPPQPDFDMENEGPQSDPAKWNVVEVYEFVKHLPGCTEYADEFRVQEIDGQALLLLKEDHLMTNMNIKLGPALKICARINALRQNALNSNPAPPTTPITTPTA